MADGFFAHVTTGDVFAILLALAIAPPVQGSTPKEDAKRAKARLHEIGNRLRDAGLTVDLVPTVPTAPTGSTRARLLHVHRRFGEVPCAVTALLVVEGLGILPNDWEVGHPTDPMIPWLGREESSSRLPAPREAVRDLPTLRDWFLATAPKLQDLHWPQALEKARRWHKRFAGGLGFRRPVPAAFPIVEWPDGARIERLLLKSDFAAEGTAMGHCVGGDMNRGGIADGESSYWQGTRDNHGVILSYRDAEGIPQATLEYHPTSDDLVQRLEPGPLDPDDSGKFDVRWADHPPPRFVQVRGPRDLRIEDILAVGRLGAFLRRLHRGVIPSGAHALTDPFDRARIGMHIPPVAALRERRLSEVSESIERARVQCRNVVPDPANPIHLYRGVWMAIEASFNALQMAGVHVFFYLARTPLAAPLGSPCPTAVWRLSDGPPPAPYAQDRRSRVLIGVDIGIRDGEMVTDWKACHDDEIGHRRPDGTRPPQPVHGPLPTLAHVLHPLGWSDAPAVGPVAAPVPAAPPAPTVPQDPLTDAIWYPEGPEGVGPVPDIACMPRTALLRLLGREAEIGDHAGGTRRS
jgi:hypothetical protein